MTTPELIDYIKKTEEQGSSVDAIRAELLKAGWKPEDIEEGLRAVGEPSAPNVQASQSQVTQPQASQSQITQPQSAQPQSVELQTEETQSVEPQSDNQQFPNIRNELETPVNKVLLVVISLVILVIIAGGVYWWQATLTDDDRNTEQQAEQQTETEPVSETVVPVFVEETEDIKDASGEKVGEVDIKIEGDAVVIVDCGEMSCFEEKFAKCEPATVTTKVFTRIYHYEIVGPKEGYCEVKSKFLANPDPTLIGKEMTCKLYNDYGFYMDVSKCEGPLYDLMIGG